VYRSYSHGPPWVFLSSFGHWQTPAAFWNFRSPFPTPPLSRNLSQKCAFYILLFFLHASCFNIPFVVSSSVSSCLSPSRLPLDPNFSFASRTPPQLSFGAPHPRFLVYHFVSHITFFFTSFLNLKFPGFIEPCQRTFLLINSSLPVPFRLVRAFVLTPVTVIFGDAMDLFAMFQFPRLPLPGMPQEGGAGWRALPCPWRSPFAAQFFFTAPCRPRAQIVFPVSIGPIPFLYM